jgi:hypothetical protein
VSEDRIYINIKILIHGPLISFGIGPNKSLMGFDCCNTIKGNIANAKLFNYETMLSISHSTKFADHSGGGLSDFGQTKLLFFNTYAIQEPDNRIKQRLGFLNALSDSFFAERSGLVLIMRTDMLMPLSFWNWLSAMQNNEGGILNGQMLFSELSPEPFYVGDFLIMAEVDKLKKILSNLISTKILIHPISNCELGLSSSGINISHFKRLNFVSVFFRYLKFRKTWTNFAKTVRTPPHDIYASIKWRDISLADIFHLKTFQFKEFDEPINLEVSITKLFLGFNYCNARLHKAEERVFSFSMAFEKLRHETNRLLFNRIN